jgi:hypothetical protein
MNIPTNLDFLLLNSLEGLFSWNVKILKDTSEISLVKASLSRDDCINSMIQHLVNFALEYRKEFTEYSGMESEMALEAGGSFPNSSAALAAPTPKI